MGILFELIEKTLAFDAEASTVEKDDDALKFKRGKDGILRSYDSTGNEVGRIYEHGDDAEEE